ncbi:histone-lysine N-methyltransferase SETMAR [Trichonephila clavipes]|nr:histone-lysine N-methyltransferase SETMAR [Trichonephila clavipes]
MSVALKIHSVEEHTKSVLIQSSHFAIVWKFRDWRVNSVLSPPLDTNHNANSNNQGEEMHPIIEYEAINETKIFNTFQRSACGSDLTSEGDDFDEFHHSQLTRKAPPSYSDGVYQMAGAQRPNARALSQALMKGRDGLASLRNLTVLFTFFGENASQGAEIANGVYGVDTVTANYVQFWFCSFRSGIFDVKDAPRTGRLIVENIDKITEIIEVDRHVSSPNFDQELKIDHKTVLSHLRKVGFKKKLHVWVPHQFTTKT